MLNSCHWTKRWSTQPRTLEWSQIRWSYRNAHTYTFLNRTTQKHLVTRTRLGMCCGSIAYKGNASSPHRSLFFLANVKADPDLTGGRALILSLRFECSLRFRLGPGQVLVSSVLLCPVGLFRWALQQIYDLVENLNVSWKKAFERGLPELIGPIWI